VHAHAQFLSGIAPILHCVASGPMLVEFWRSLWNTGSVFRRRRKIGVWLSWCKVRVLTNNANVQTYGKYC
jgi:hypothetical protein